MQILTFSEKSSTLPRKGEANAAALAELPSSGYFCITAFSTCDIFVTCRAGGNGAVSGTSALGCPVPPGHTQGLIGPHTMETEPLTPPTRVLGLSRFRRRCLASLRGTEGRIAWVGRSVLLPFLWQALSQTGGVQSSA